MFWYWSIYCVSFIVLSADCLRSVNPHSFLLWAKKVLNYFGARHSNHLDEQYGGHISFWLPVTLRMYAHVFYTCVCLRSRPQSFHLLPSCKLWSDIWMLHLLFLHRCVLTHAHTNLCYNCLRDVWYNLATVVFGKGEQWSITCPDPDWRAQIPKGKPSENRKASKFTSVLTHRAYAGWCICPSACDLCFTIAFSSD